MGMSASQARLLSLTSRMSDVEFSAQKLANAKTRLTSESEQVGKEYNEALEKKKFVFLTGYNKSTAQYTDVTANRLMNYNPGSVETQKILTNIQGLVMVSSSMKANFEGALNTSKANNTNSFDEFIKSYGLARTQDAATASGLSYDSDKIAYYKNLFEAIQGAGGCFAPDKDEYLNDSAWVYNQLQNGSLYLKEWKSSLNSAQGGFEEISWQTGDNSLQEVEDESGQAAAKAKYDLKMTQIQSNDKKYDLELKQLDTEHSALQTEYDSVKKVMDKNIESSFKSFG